MGLSIATVIDIDKQFVFRISYCERQSMTSSHLSDWTGTIEDSSIVSLHMMLGFQGRDKF